MTDQLTNCLPGGNDMTRSHWFSIFAVWGSISRKMSSMPSDGWLAVQRTLKANLPGADLNIAISMRLLQPITTHRHGLVSIWWRTVDWRDVDYDKVVACTVWVVYGDIYRTLYEMSGRENLCTHIFTFCPWLWMLKLGGISRVPPSALRKEAVLVATDRLALKINHFVCEGGGR